MKNAILSVSVLAMLAASGAAMAQSRVVAASDKVAADNAPLGLRAGSFLVIPKVDVEGTFNDNIYATTNNTESDFITTVRPQVAVKSNWSRHAVNAVANLEEKRYADNTSEDVTNYTVALDGRADIMRETSIGGGVAIARAHEDRGDPNSLGSGVEPTQFDTMTARIGAYRGLGKANVRIDSEARDIDYDNGRTAGGAVVNNNLRDRKEYSQSLRAGYRFTPSMEAFVKAVADTRAYDIKGSGGSLNRGNHGQTYTGGLNFDLTGKTKGEVFAGYARRNYVDRGLKDINEPTFGGNLTYNFSPLTTFKAGIERGIEETTLGASSGYVGTDYSVGVEHALRRNVLLTAKAGYTDNQYKGFAANQRHDKIAVVGAGIDWWLNRCLKAGIGYEYRDRNSNVTGGDFNRNLVMLKLTGTY